MRKLLAAAGIGALLALTLPAAAQATGPAADGVTGVWNGQVTLAGSYAPEAADGCLPAGTETATVTWDLVRAAAPGTLTVATVSQDLVGSLKADATIATEGGTLTGTQQVTPGSTVTLTVVGATNTNTATATVSVPQVCNQWDGKAALAQTHTYGLTRDGCVPAGKKVAVSWRLAWSGEGTLTVGSVDGARFGRLATLVKGAQIKHGGRPLVGTVHGVNPGDHLVLTVVGAGNNGHNTVSAEYTAPAVCIQPSASAVDDEPSEGATADPTGTVSTTPVAYTDGNGGTGSTLPVTGWPLTLTIAGGTLLLLTGALLVAVTWRRRDRIRFQA